MGYRSQVVFKTTTEGYVVMKKFNDTIDKYEDKPLAYLDVERTESGYYKISQGDIKWYESYLSVSNFNKVLDMLEAEVIPYKFIRLGEDDTDIEVRENYTDDMPDELCEFNPEISVYDSNEGEYDTVSLGSEEARKADEAIKFSAV